MSKSVTLISAKAEIKGNIHVSDALQIEGVIRGNILADPDSNSEVTIGLKGIVEGEIRAPHIVVNGEVRGDVYSSDHITLNKNALITGDIHYVMMEMVMGSKVSGKLLHIPSEQENQLSQAPKPKTMINKNDTVAPLIAAGQKK